MHRLPQKMRPEIRRLWKADEDMLVAYFLKLDSDTRRLRFCASVSDTRVEAYARNLINSDALVFGAFPDGKLRGVAELCILPDSLPRRAEVALLVEPDWQDYGLGDALLHRVVAAAQNRLVHTLEMSWLPENKRMQALAEKNHAIMGFDPDDVEATLDPPSPTPLSIIEEVVADSRSYLRSIYHVKAPADPVRPEVAPH
ncbi:GNAT family N-acetyltransferase [Sulfitobacter aestuariivivens]|uniref:GNAT family N-acetyltransferase n=1 Tax=Sulfitobacter aestuariivivens TaxID=2766981 RepID=A0A927HGH0_9RHOB|nr:GNAT family N-acetyltransferase [Sulfitobacter aestuariivivens]MBD3665966.1 GNAT family N-acetyltransferase [Sulfitobacter aestuariivivens]